MLTLHTYIVRQIAAVLFVALTVFIAVLLLGNAFKEVLVLLVNRQVSVGAVLQMLALQIPWLLSYALPLGFLAAVLLVFGRLSADQELVAMRAGGISLAAGAWPVIGVSVVCCLLSLLINTHLAPRCRIQSKQVVGGVIRSPMDLIVPGRYVRDFPGWTVYIKGKKDERLEGVLLYGHDKEGQLAQRVEADAGSVRVDEHGGEVVFCLENATFYFRGESGAAGDAEGGDVGWETFRIGQTEQKIPLSQGKERSIEPDLSEMTRTQLREELVRARDEGLAVGPVLFHLHRQQASSFACFAFVLVGIPLGIRAHRRETSVGLALALVIAVVYYAFQAFAQSLEAKPSAMPHLLVWIPNFVFIGIGGWLTWRANRGLV